MMTINPAFYLPMHIDRADALAAASSTGSQLMNVATRAPLAECRAALIEGLAKSGADISLDDRGYVHGAEANLVEGVFLEDFERDLAQGNGNELGGKFRAAHSSSALAVNTFAPFKRNPAALRLPGGGEFNTLSFERKCPHGIPGRNPPNLDLVAEGTGGVVAVESKCLEPLSPHKAEFAPAYFMDIRDERTQTPWYEEMLHLVREPWAYRWLDAATDQTCPGYPAHVP